MEASSPGWSSLLPDLLGQVIARLPHLADHARFRAVCRSWRSAMRLHVSPRRWFPWVVLEDGAYLTPSDGGVHHLPLPRGTRCVGSTGLWIALDRTDDVTQKHTYTLHNHFTGATVPLPELDSVLGSVPKEFEIRKVLMRSTPDDLVAVTGNIWKHPLILCRPGKGAWVARPVVLPYFSIIDVAFLGDKLYAITKAENLFAIHLAEDGEGKPCVSTVKRIIRHAPGHNGDIFDDDMWTGLTDIEEDSDDEESSVEDNYDVLNQEDAHDEFLVDGSDTDGHNENIAFSVEYTLSECVDGVKEGDYVVYTCRHLIGSQGKLLMVKREWLVSAFTPTDYTRKVEVFEANMDVGAWVALSNGVGGGQAIFISNRFSNVVSACGEVEEDIMYFPDTDDVFDMRSGTIRPLTPINRLYDWWKAWVFPPDLVV